MSGVLAACINSMHRLFNLLVSIDSSSTLKSRQPNSSNPAVTFEALQTLLRLNFRAVVLIMDQYVEPQSELIEGRFWLNPPNYKFSNALLSQNGLCVSGPSLILILATLPSFTTDALTFIRRALHTKYRLTEKAHSYASRFAVPAFGAAFGELSKLSSSGGIKKTFPGAQQSSEVSSPIDVIYMIGMLHNLRMQLNRVMQLITTQLSDDLNVADPVLSQLQSHTITALWSCVHLFSTLRNCFLDSFVAQQRFSLLSSSSDCHSGPIFDLIDFIVLFAKIKLTSSPMSAKIERLRLWLCQEVVFTIISALNKNPSVRSYLSSDLYSHLLKALCSCAPNSGNYNTYHTK